VAFGGVAGRQYGGQFLPDCGELVLDAGAWGFVRELHAQVIELLLSGFDTGFQELLLLCLGVRRGFMGMLPAPGLCSTGWGAEPVEFSTGRGELCF
jgi:hypothetical protein